MPQEPIALKALIGDLAIFGVYDSLSLANLLAFMPNRAGHGLSSDLEAPLVVEDSHFLTVLVRGFGKLLDRDWGLDGDLAGNSQAGRAVLQAIGQSVQRAHEGDNFRLARLDATGF
jgi:hypothetical protein